MFERFTELSRQVVVRAQDEARKFKHGQISSAHLLLGLTQLEESLAARVLASMDVTYDLILAKVAERYPEEEDGSETTGQIPFTPEARQVLELALREALSLGHNYIGTEHILLALIRDPSGGGRPSIGCEILTEDFEGVTAERIRNTALRVLSGPVQPRRADKRVHLEVTLEDAERLLTALRTSAPVPRASWPLQDKLVIAIHDAQEEGDGRREQRERE